MKIHILAPYPKGEAPSQRFRFEQYISTWEEEGFEVCFHSFHSLKSWKRLYTKGNFTLKISDTIWNFIRRWVLMFQLINAKHIFMHREMAHIGPPIFEWILVKIMRKKYVIDFDDAIWMPNYSASNAFFQRLKCYWKTKHLIKWASKVQVGNDYLADYARKFNANISVVPTTIDTINHHKILCDHQKKPVVIGWTGTHSTSHYLDFLIPILKKLEKEYAFEFRVISNKKPDFILKSLRYQEWNAETEIADLAEIQIGVMPLIDNEWANGKCGFKALQYMSLGIASIVSPVGVNSKIIENNKTGFLALTPTDWENCFRNYLMNPELRVEFGNKARKVIIDKWSVESWRLNYRNLFQ